jgi:hypothetical protein
MTESIEPLIERLNAAESRLEELSTKPFPPGQTDPDPGGEETWDAARVWAHLAEFLGYWTDQAKEIAANPAGDVPQFGRMKTDPSRVDPIERDRLLPPDQLWARLDGGIHRARDLFESFSDEQLDHKGIHPVFGEQPVRFILERFVVVHLEEHANQLDKLATEAAEANAEV